VGSVTRRPEARVILSEEEHAQLKAASDRTGLSLGELLRRGYFGGDLEPTPVARRRTPYYRAGPLTCEVASCRSGPLKSRDTLSAHVMRAHQLTLREYVELHGEPVVLSLEEAAALKDARSTRPS
jgi:hypothetical protein